MRRDETLYGKKGSSTRVFKNENIFEPWRQSNSHTLEPVLQVLLITMVQTVFPKSIIFFVSFGFENFWSFLAEVDFLRPRFTCSMTNSSKGVQ